MKMTEYTELQKGDFRICVYVPEEVRKLGNGVIV